MSHRKGLLSLLLLAAVSTASSGQLATADYETLAAHRYGAPQPVPDGGLEWDIDVAHWSLATGSVQLQDPVAGVTPGLWFEGRGEVAVEIPDAVELRQLRRLLGEPEMDRFRLSFDKLLLRCSGGPPTTSFAATTAGGSEIPEAEKRHEHYLRLRRFDVDARILAALGIPGAVFWQADVHSDEHGWVTFTYDSRRAEEITVEYFDSGHDFLESWVSLDRAADRRPDGRPTSRFAPLYTLDHVDITADLTRAARKYSGSIDGLFSTRLDLEIAGDGLLALPFELHPRAKVTRVADAEGRELPFVRHHIGGEASSIDKDIHDASLLVLLPSPVAAGSKLSIRVDYELRLAKYAPGRSWYPGHRDSGGLHDRHTARFEMTTDDRHDLQAMGERIEEREGKETRTSVWQLDQPAKMVTFAMQKGQYRKETVQEGLPTVTTVGNLDNRLTGLNEERIDQVAADTVNAIDYLQQVLDAPLPDSHLYAALIPSSHGQAFPGFLHLGEFTAVLDTAAAVERFRAHEAGHQWWGHLVGWNSYRDQWLSEGFAEYMALMYLHDAVENGPKIFEEAVTAYTNEVIGSIETAFSRFARPGAALLTARGAERIGPIGHGWRAATGETPTAYTTQAYTKAALVLHMLRQMTQRMTGSDDAFIAILRDFVETNTGRFASTRDFREAVERQVPADWSWFFDQWVYGAEIPTYLWEYDIAPGRDGGLTLRLTVEQRDVTPGFKMLVPVDVEFGKKKIGRMAVFVDEPLETFELALPTKPKKVHFNPGNAVLARVKKR